MLGGGAPRGAASRKEEGTERTNERTREAAEAKGAERRRLRATVTRGVLSRSRARRRDPHPGGSRRRRGGEAVRAHRAIFFGAGHPTTAERAGRAIAVLARRHSRGRGFLCGASRSFSSAAAVSHSPSGWLVFRIKLSFVLVGFLNNAITKASKLFANPPEPWPNWRW